VVGGWYRNGVARRSAVPRVDEEDDYESDDDGMFLIGLVIGFLVARLSPRLDEEGDYESDDDGMFVVGLVIGFLVARLSPGSTKRATMNPTRMGCSSSVS